MLRRLAAIVMAALVAVIVATPVAAAQPTIDRYEWAFDLTGAPCSSTLSYDIHLDVNEIDRDYGDRFVAHLNVDGEAMGSNGVVVTVHHAWTETWDFEAGTVTFTGLGAGNRVIGTSVRQLERGLVVVDMETFEILRSAGKGDFAAFDPHLVTCDLLMQAGG